MKINDNSAPFFSFFVAVAKLARFKTSLLVGLATACGYLLQIAESKSYLLDPVLMLACLGAGFFLMASMNTLNDVVDVESDKIVKPERMIPRGVISTKVAMFVASIEIIFGVVLLLYLGLFPLLLGLMVLIFSISYSLFLQKYPLVKNVLVGFGVSASLLVGALSAPSVLSSQIIVIFLASFIAFTAFELHKDIGDVKGDQKSGKKTLPVMYGESNAFKIAFILYITALLVLTIGLILLSESPMLTLLLGGIGGGAVLSITPSLRTVHSCSVQRQRVIMMTAFAVILLLLLSSAFYSVITSYN